jgi:dienelactone hydrolase
MIVSSRVAAFASVVALFASVPVAQAQQEFPPPDGSKGRIVLVSSGMSGPGHYKEISKDIAALGYDVLLVDGNAEENTHGDGLRADIQKAIAAPHGLPGKIALVGFSLGGGEQLYYGTQLPDQVAGVVVWFPANAFIKNVPGFASRLAVPVVAFAGGKDHYRNGCCTAAGLTTLEGAAKSAGKSFDLTVYPDADHGFVKGDDHYNPKDSADAFAKTAEALKTFFANNPSSGTGN